MLTTKKDRLEKSAQDATIKQKCPNIRWKLGFLMGMLCVKYELESDPPLIGELRDELTLCMGKCPQI